MPRIDPVVDFYNALSISAAVPIGGEDLARYQGIPRLVFANETEKFETSRDGAPLVEYPDEGEIVWSDDAGATCRRWNWRQCRRTAITPSTTDFWFIFDRLAPLALDDLRVAGDRLIAAFRSASPQCNLSSELLEPPFA